ASPFDAAAECSARHLFEGTLAGEDSQHPPATGVPRSCFPRGCEMASWVPCRDLRGLVVRRFSPRPLRQYVICSTTSISGRLTATMKTIACSIIALPPGGGCHLAPVYRSAARWRIVFRFEKEPTGRVDDERESGRFQLKIRAFSRERGDGVRRAGEEAAS